MAAIVHDAVKDTETIYAAVVDPPVAAMWLVAANHRKARVDRVLTFVSGLPIGACHPGAG